MDGLEEVGAKELSELGAVNIQPGRRGIYFQSDPATLYRINYCSRLCSRILAPVASFTCKDTEDIYRAARTVSWDSFIRTDHTFAVFANTASSTVSHSKYAALKLKDAVVDQFRDRYGRRPDVNTHEPDLWLNLFIGKGRGTIAVDTSGGSLHRRGYRVYSVKAPMQETLAAAMVRFSQWDGTAALVDPMCGAGTLIIEAAMSHCRIPAGYLRRCFGFQRLPDYSENAWKTVKDQADSRIRKLPAGRIYGSDIDPDAVLATRANFKMIPHARNANILRMDFRDIEHLENRVILCNPPYGVRMKTQEELSDVYRQLGDFLKRRCKGSQAYIYFGNREMIKCIGLKPSWKKPLRNGGLDGRLVKYELY